MNVIWKFLSEWFGDVPNWAPPVITLFLFLVVVGLVWILASVLIRKNRDRLDAYLTRNITRD